MPEIAYSLLNPTGNMTLLVESPVPASRQPALAGKLMALEPETEQVGFVSFPDADGEETVFLRMAGGEFCGNAAMSAAALYLERSGRKDGAVSVCVTGTERPVEVTLTDLSDGSRQGTVAMPKPVSVRREKLPSCGQLPVVRFPGITHVIAEAPFDGTLTPENAEKLGPEFCALLGAEALGLMFLNRAQGSLTPLVYVPDAGTLCWESSCASGTTAVGAWLAAEAGRPLALQLRQPGGTLKISAEPGGNLFLTGTVHLIHSRTCEIPD